LSVRECALVVGVNLADWAESVVAAPRTAGFGEGTLPVPARVCRLIVVKTATVASDSTSGVVGSCARVSSHDRHSDLDRRVARLTAWAIEHDLKVGQVVCGVGSG
jgi:putative resolvase